MGPSPRHPASRRLIAPIIAAVRGDAWFAPPMAKGLALVSIALSAGMLLAVRGKLPLNGGIGSDFVVFWSAARAIASGAKDLVYSPEAFHAFQQSVTGYRFEPILPWVYPPHMLFVVAPLATLPFGASMAAWLVATGLLYAAVVARVHGKGAWSFVGALAFPPVAMNIAHAQTGFLTAALFAYALWTLPSRPVVAGIAFGVLTVKPQLGVLVPLALVAGRNGRAILSAALSALGASVAATAFFGLDSWSRMLAGMRWMQATMSGTWLITELQSPFAALRVLGVDVQAALVAHAVVAVATAIVVIAVWRGPADTDLKAAALLVGSALASPYFYHYDAMILAPAMAFVARNAAVRGWRSWEPVTLIAIAELLLYSNVVAVHTGVLPGPLCSLALLALVVRRTWSPEVLAGAGAEPGR